MSDIRLQEIFTRAVVGRGDRRVTWSCLTPAEGADAVLGVHVSKAELCVEAADCGPMLQVKVACDVWCGVGDGSRVHRLVCTHAEPADVSTKGQVLGETEVRARLVRGVRCTQAELAEGGQLALTFEAYVAIEVTGLARLWVRAFDLQAEEQAIAASSYSQGESGAGSSGRSADGSGSETTGSDSSGDEDEVVRTMAVESDSAPAREVHTARVQPSRRAAVLSHFQQTVGPARIAVIQSN